MTDKRPREESKEEEPELKRANAMVGDEIPVSLEDYLEAHKFLRKLKKRNKTTNDVLKNVKEIKNTNMFKRNIKDIEKTSTQIEKKLESFINTINVIKKININNQGIILTDFDKNRKNSAINGINWAIDNEYNIFIKEIIDVLNKIIERYEKQNFDEKI